MRRMRAALGIGVVLATMAFAGIAAAGSTTATLKEISGVDHGDGTATYKGTIEGSKECRKGRKVTLNANGGPGAAPFKAGSDKTNSKGKFSFDGKMAAASQGFQLTTKAKGDCQTPFANLRHDEVFE
jgi:hypothetical protein